jgi:hypothetical protein
MVMSTKMAVFWDIALCSQVDINLHFREAYVMMEAVSSSEMSVNIYQATQQPIRQPSS